jgi:response regulator RpfG family c-di-GMP phosphodiesterase
MQFAPLSTVKHRVAVGVPLPFNVYNNNRSLLLARGKCIDSEDQFEALLDRGVLINLDDLADPADIVRRAPASMLPTIWEEQRKQMLEAMRDTSPVTFRSRLESATQPLEVLIQRDKDLAIFQMLRQEGSPRLEYGVHHAMHAAVISLLIATRLNWTLSDCNLAIKTALTMNLSMLELQGVLAGSTLPPTAEQRHEIDTHPMRSREILEASEVTDPMWLRAVEEHHERPDGSGYPRRLRDVCELASLIRSADIYAAKLGARAGREPIPADQAIRKIYMSDPDNVFVAALVKELGLYPPGSYVALASGETGIVIKRGVTITSPIVAAITNRQRQPLPRPVRRDTSRPGLGVVAMLAKTDLPIPLKPQSVAALMAA